MKNKKNIFIGIGILLAIVLVIIAVLLVNKPKSEKDIKKWEGTSKVFLPLSLD